jgi:hypothetical protein
MREDWVVYPCATATAARFAGGRVGPRSARNGCLRRVSVGVELAICRSGARKSEKAL